MTARRTLTPAARGVSLGVLAALRAGRVDLADQADGSTLATSTAPDGTKLMTCTLWQPVTVRGVDTRTPGLPNVSMVPAPAAETPAPVAVVREPEAPAPEPAVPAQPEPVRIHGLAPGDLITLDDGRARVGHVDHEGFMWAGVDRHGFSVDPVERCLWSEVEHIEGDRWRARHADEVTEAPATQAPPRDEHNGIAVGDVVSLDDEAFRVTVSDEYGWQGETVATTPRGRPLATVHCDWDDIERVGDRAWRTRPTREKLRTVTDEGAPVSKGAAKPAKKVAKPKAPKAAPRAGLVPEDEDALWEIVLEDWPAKYRELDMLDAETVILWTYAPGDHIRTIVPGKHIPTIRTRAIDGGATVLREEPSGDPCHLAVIGGEVETTGGPMGLMGVCDDYANGMIGLVLEGARTVDGGKPFVAWADDVKVIDGRVVVTLSKWWTAVRDGETWRAERLPEEWKALAPSKPKRAPKARPARLTPEPEADALTRHGQRCVVAMLHEGSAWELVWCDEMPGQMTHDVAWASVVEQAHRARRYDRGGHCAADTRDTPRAEVSRGE